MAPSCPGFGTATLGRKWVALPFGEGRRRAQALCWRPASCLDRSTAPGFEEAERVSRRSGRTMTTMMMMMMVMVMMLVVMMLVLQ